MFPELVHFMKSTLQNAVEEYQVEVAKVPCVAEASPDAAQPVKLSPEPPPSDVQPQFHHI